MMRAAPFELRALSSIASGSNKTIERGSCSANLVRASHCPQCSTKSDPSLCGTTAGCAGVGGRPEADAEKTVTMLREKAKEVKKLLFITQNFHSERTQYAIKYEAQRGGFVPGN